MRERRDEWCGPMERETSDPTVTCSVQGSKWGTLVCFEGGGCRSGGETRDFRGVGEWGVILVKIASGMRRGGKSIWRGGRGPAMAWGTGRTSSGLLGSQSAAGSRPRGPSSQVPRPLGTLRAQVTGEAFSLRPQHDQTCPFAEDAIIIFFSVVKYLPWPFLTKNTTRNTFEYHLV